MTARHASLGALEQTCPACSSAPGFYCATGHGDICRERWAVATLARLVDGGGSVMATISGVGTEYVIGHDMSPAERPYCVAVRSGGSGLLGVNARLTWRQAMNLVLDLTEAEIRNEVV